MKNQKNKIIGGATIWARQTIDSDIFFYKPDKWFKIWFYLVNRVNHKDCGKFTRGSGLITYEDIMHATKASKTQVHKCLKYLEKDNMIDYSRTTRGMIRNIINYDKYQLLDNYQTTDKTTTATMERQLGDNSETLPIDKNEKNEKNEKTSSKEEGALPKISEKESSVSVLKKEKESSAKEKEIVTYGKENINTFLADIKKITGRPPVAGQQARRYASNFLKNLKKEYPDNNENVLAAQILTIAMELQDGWHTTKCHDPKHLFYNWQEIIAKKIIPKKRTQTFGGTVDLSAS